MIIRSRRLYFALALMSAAIATSAEAKKAWVFFDFPNATAVAPLGISGHNHIVGNYQKSTADYLHGFLRTPDGTVSEVSYPGAALTATTGINYEGAIVGFYAGQDGMGHGYVRDAGGNYQTIDFPGTSSSTAWAIGDDGTIVGNGSVSQVEIDGFVRKPDGTVTAIIPPSAANTIPIAINQRGRIAGYFIDQHSRTHGFLRKPGGKIVVFDVPGATSLSVTGMNGKDEIVGVYQSSTDSQYHSFLRRSDGTITSFDPSGPGIATATNSIAMSINYRGEIVGSFGDANDTSHGYVREPDGSFVQLDAPGASTAGTVATAIAADGKIIGYTANEGGFRINRKAWKGE